ncbi:MAG: hypothetical protein ACD_51C00166G0001 [uncultured bacterium]|nr:MAG: hypothetical protein ACD_51C00166G0001 [uncultured bacterium]
MRPITIRFINTDISDIYCYVGMLVFTTHIGEVYALSLSSVYSTLSVKYREFRSFLKIALINNEWISNDQYQALIQSQTKITFEKEWNKAARMLFEYKVDIADCQALGRTSGFPVYDIKAYAHHIFIAHGKGLDDFHIDGDSKSGLKLQQRQKMFDLRVLSISAKIGQVLVSTGRNGLFSGSIWDERFKINEREIEKESYRTLWSNWNFNNYTDATSFRHFINDTIDEPERKFFYSKQDEERSKKRLTNIGKKIIESDQLIENRDNSFIVNSNDLFFLFKNSGDIVSQRLKRDKSTSYMSSYSKVIYPGFRKKVLDVKTAKNCLAIETFDSLELLTNSEIVTLSECAPLNFRAYLSSIRLRNLVSATYPEYSELYLHA